MRRHKQEVGSALLTALFIMTLVAIVATAMTTRLQLDIYRTNLLVTHDKLYLASQAVQFWSFSELNNKKNSFSKSEKQGLVASYPDNLTSIYRDVTLKGELYDLQARVNLNNLVDVKRLPGFIKFLKNSDEEIDAKQAKSLALAIRDWISPYDLSHGKDSYMSYYLSQNPPYYPSHQLMKSPSELRLIQGIDTKKYLNLLRYISVLPETTAVNINTASPAVLASLGDGISKEQVEQLLEAKGNAAKDLNKLNPILQSMNIPNGQVSVLSTYFLSVTYASNQDDDLVVYRLIKRAIDNAGNVSVSMLQESINTY